MEKDFWKIHKNKISLLISNKENDIWKIIHNMNGKNLDCSAHIVNYVEQLIISYICVSKKLGDLLPYNDIKDFFFYCNPEGVDEYEKFNKNMLHKSHDDSCEDKLIFLLRHTEGEICNSVSDVLNDNNDDPHFSAVYSSNMIKCFIEISTAAGYSLLYNDVYGFFIAHGFSINQYYDFEIKRKTEADYYQGVQY